MSADRRLPGALRMMILSASVSIEGYEQDLVDADFPMSCRPAAISIVSARASSKARAHPPSVREANPTRKQWTAFFGVVPIYQAQRPFLEQRALAFGGHRPVEARTRGSAAWSPAVTCARSRSSSPSASCWTSQLSVQLVGAHPPK